MQSNLYLNCKGISHFQNQIFLFSFEPKNERAYNLNSALVSKISQIKENEGICYIDLGILNTIESFFLPILDP